ncbi:ABC transporter ATP-binding protein [[Mycoplasma] collis]|uniref:ABC transporter ATP-binding protein n=1 Tax=[Mycoplasma] collis TaxID=2127 RepID=UPI00068E0376|nr:ATP-binding cassette domain-containing protein [[Mycoplasma] collis]
MDQLNNKIPSFLTNIKNEFLSKNKLNNNQNNNILELKNINKIYSNGFQAIFKTNLSVKKGEFVSLLGPSGCGKSTTLRIIAGLEEINQGEIYINNINVTHSEPASRNITMVFQNYALFPHLSIYKNIAFGLNANKNKILNDGKLWQEINFKKNQISEINWKIQNIYSINKSKKNLIKLKNQYKNLKEKYQLLNNIPNQQEKKAFKMLTKLTFLESIIEFKNENINHFEKLKLQIEQLKIKKVQIKSEIKNLVSFKPKLSLAEKKEIINQKVEKSAKILGLDLYLNRKPSQLSGGQRQRVALGRSIVNNPVLFLMDEPLSNLDAKLRATMRQEIRKLHEKINSGTIYVTHDQVEAMTMSDKLAVMNDGFILQIGSPKEVYKNPSCLFVAGFVGAPAMNFIEGVYKNKKFVSKEGLEIDIPIYKTKYLTENQKITLGIRPTDFSSDDLVYESYKLKLKLFILHKELLGNEIQYKAKIHNTNHEITFITSSYKDFKLNENIEIFMISSRIHIFDTTSTIALSSEFNLETIEHLENWINSSAKIAIRRKILENSKNKKIKNSLTTKTFNFIKSKIKVLNKKITKEKNEKNI